MAVICPLILTVTFNVYLIKIALTNHCIYRGILLLQKHFIVTLCEIAKSSEKFSMKQSK